MSANYIYTEGKRLEAMSLRLLDIIVTKRSEAELRQYSAEEIFTYLKEMYGDDRGWYFAFPMKVG